MYIILLMLAVQIFFTCSVLLCSMSYPLSDVFSLSWNRTALWQFLVAPGALLLLLGDKEVLVCSNTFILGTLDFSGLRDRFKVQRMLVNQNAVSPVKAIYDHVVMLSKNQSAYSPGSHLINLGANSCKLINHGIKPSGQQ